MANCLLVVSHLNPIDATEYCVADISSIDSNEVRILATWRHQHTIDANSITNIIVAGDLNIMLDSKEKKGEICGRYPLVNTGENLISFWDLINFKPKKR